MKPKTWLAIGALVLLAGGVLLGLLPRTTEGAGRSIECGSVWSPQYNDAVSASNEAGRGADFRKDCSSARTAVAIPSYVLLGLGVVAFIGAAMVDQRSRQRTA